MHTKTHTYIQCHNIYICGADLVQTNLSFHLSEILFVSPLFLKDIFSVYKILAWQFFFFSLSISKMFMVFSSWCAFRSHSYTHVIYTHASQGRRKREWGRNIIWNNSQLYILDRLKLLGSVLQIKILSICIQSFSSAFQAR